MTSKDAMYYKEAIRQACSEPGNLQPHGPAQQALYAAVLAILDHFQRNADREQKAADYIQNCVRKP